MNPSHIRKPRPHRLHKHLLALRLRESLWSEGDVIVVGVSGGGDSMCLLHALAQLAKKERLTLIAAHVNYGLRGADADRDERHVVRTCARLGITCEVHRTPRRSSTREVEMRELRHAFFGEIALAYSATRIALAHTMDDHAETLLMRLVTGAGVQGLGNMSFHDGQIIRPLLETTGRDARAYCRAVGIRYYNDYTNTDQCYMRNRIRHSTLPHLATYNPQIIRTLSESAHRLHDAATVQDSMLPDLIPWRCAHQVITFVRGDYALCAPAVRRSLLRYLCRTLAPHDRDISYRGIRGADQMIVRDKKKHAQMHVGSLIITCKNATVKITLRR